ncbi:MAG: hypothetical protein RR955_02780 [Raoultibacter sp.]
MRYPPTFSAFRHPPSPLREAGNLLVFLMMILTMLCALLAFGVDAAAVISQKMTQENALNSVRELRMSPIITLEAKNSNDPGGLIARTFAKSLRQQGYAGTIEVWFHEVDRAEGKLPINVRVYAYEVVVSDLCDPAFSRTFGVREIPVTSCLVTSSAPYAEFEAWRPPIVRSGVFRLEAQKSPAHLSFTTASLAHMPSGIRTELATRIDNANQHDTKG